MKLYKLDKLILKSITKEGTTSRYIRNTLVDSVSNCEITKSLNKLIESGKIEVVNNLPNSEINGCSYILID